MTTRKILGSAIAFAFLCAGSAQAQISRVFVGVSGNDLNVCSNQATPCRTIGGGIAQVDLDGEVIIMETGSYAGGIITKAVKVTAAPGIVAFSGMPIKVNVAASRVVVLRGLTIKAATPGVNSGILHQSGKLFVENCVIDGWSTGIYMLGGHELTVTDSVIRNNTVLAGLNIESGEAILSRVRIINNNVGLRVLGQVGSLAYLSDSVVAHNSVGLFQFDQGVLVSMGDNLIRANALATSGTISNGALQ